MIILLYFF